ncbi:MAG: DUF421 domain-containing protein [Clostridiales bacterium]|nr:DUF421 domain-containing protein [Clostridiales bacterium]
MEIYLQIIIRCIITFVAFGIMTTILGIKHIAQATTFDYIVSIVIGSVGAVLCVDTDIAWYYCVLAMGVLVFFAWLLNLLNRKTAFVRRYITGTPVLLISQGNIMYEGLKKCQFSVNDLLRELRYHGYFYISDVEDAVLESNGQLSVLPKEAKRVVTLEDLNIKKSEKGLVSNVIIDGKIIEGNLRAMNRTEEWLKAKLAEQEVGVERVLLGTLDGQGELSLYRKDYKKQRWTILE